MYDRNIVATEKSPITEYPRIKNSNLINLLFISEYFIMTPATPKLTKTKGFTFIAYNWPGNFRDHIDTECSSHMCKNVGNFELTCNEV